MEKKSDSKNREIKSGGGRPRRKSPKKNSRVALFIDGMNLWYAQQKLNYRIDYVKLKNYWVNQPHLQLYNAFFYTGYHVQPDEEKQQFLDVLVNHGYTLRTKTVKTIYDSELKKDVYKCNLDVEIVIDMLTTIDMYDVAVLISGDGDFERAVEVLRVRGKLIYASCCKAMTSRDLLTAVDRFYWLEDLKSEIAYSGSGSPANRMDRYQKELFSEVQI